jgi:hypothetical protein
VSQEEDTTLDQLEDDWAISTAHPYELKQTFFALAAIVIGTGLRFRAR